MVSRRVHKCNRCILLYPCLQLHLNFHLLKGCVFLVCIEQSDWEYHLPSLLRLANNVHGSVKCADGWFGNLWDRVNVLLFFSSRELTGRAGVLCSCLSELSDLDFSFARARLALLQLTANVNTLVE